MSLVNPAPCQRRNPAESGFALIEALIAVLIFSLGILGLVGLQATTTQSTTVAKARIDASFIAAQRIAEIWGSNLAALSTMAETDTDISGLLPEGKRTTTVVGNDITVTVTWKMPKEPGVQTYSTVAVVAPGNGP